MVRELLEYLDRKCIGYGFDEDGDLTINDMKCWVSEGAEDGRSIDLQNLRIFGLPEEPDLYDMFIFQFGGIWYHSFNEEVDLAPLEYVGKCTKKNQSSRCFLGVHGAMEILSGTRLYEDWARKAKWAGYEQLGLCELNTLAGAMKFQTACLSHGLKPIIGMSVNVMLDAINTMRLKLFVADAQGWANLLEISKVVSLDNNGQGCDLETIHKWSGGLVIIIDPKYTNFKKCEKYLDETWLFSFEPVEMLSTKADNEYVKNLSDFYNSDIPRVSSVDAHYLERDHAFIMDTLNRISKIALKVQPTKQWLMTEDDYRVEVGQLVKNAVKADEICVEAIENSNAIGELCDFTIPLMSPEARHLPAYNMTENELSKFGSAEKLMDHLVEEGLQAKIPKEKHPEYRERIKMEFEVLDFGNVRDYFLILWDIINWSRANDILVGVGRGSAAGSLIAYLMDITRIDPLEYGLLFERFLNVGRVQKSLPDIDVDFSGLRRDEVKQYITERYGATQFCDVGTYTNMKPKSLIKELGKRDGQENFILNEVTKYWGNDLSSLNDVLKETKSDRMAKSLFHKIPNTINDQHLLLLQPRAESIHACATIVVPADRQIHQYFPVKYMVRDGRRIVVSQWEGGELEMTGFLKEDILGVVQLDKYEMMLRRIKEDTGDDLDIYSIPLDDPDVMEMFKRGDNSDVFHFGSDGLTQFCKVMKPDDINDLIAANSLFRPGPMEQGFHMQYVRRKNGSEPVSYLPECKEITEDTYGVLCYQEQIMRICQHVGGLTLVEADSIRKAMVKKNIKAIGQFVDKFKDTAMNKHGISQEDTDKLWETLLAFAKYAFNKSHAAAYSVTAYFGQWIKRYYPLQYWATTFSFADEKKYPKFLSEIHRSEGMSIHPPQINISSEGVVADKNTGDMYWSLKGIKGCGEKAYKQIVEIREKCGGYSSFENFLKHNTWKANKKEGIEGTKVNKSVIEALIASGAFDHLEGIIDPSERKMLLDAFRTSKKVKVDPAKDKFSSDFIDCDWYWGILQKQACGIATFDYEQIAMDEFGMACILETDDLPLMCDGEVVNAIGYVVSVTIKKTKKGQKMATLVLENNFVNYEMRLWPSTYEENKAMIDNAEGKIICASGKVNVWKETRSIMADGNVIGTL